MSHTFCGAGVLEQLSWVVSLGLREAGCWLGLLSFELEDWLPRWLILRVLIQTSQFPTGYWQETWAPHHMGISIGSWLPLNK